MPAALAPIAGAVVGGLMSDSGGGGQQTASKDPWGPAAKPLTNSINTLQDLERYYQQNQFNPLQQQGYQNLFSDLDQYRNQVQPGLMDFANGMMNYNYQRGPRNSQVEAMQSRNAMQGQGNPMPQGMQQNAPRGLLDSGQQNVFQGPAQGSYGLLNMSAMNPHTNGALAPPPQQQAPAATKTPEQLAQEEWERLVQSGEAYRGAGA